jgi:hypothetical protein
MIKNRLEPNYQFINNIIKMNGIFISFHNTSEHQFQMFVSISECEEASCASSFFRPFIFLVEYAILDQHI